MFTLPRRYILRYYNDIIYNMMYNIILLNSSDKQAPRYLRLFGTIYHKKFTCYNAVL